MRRVLCLWFPLWPIQRLRHARPELRRVPIVLYEPRREKMVVTLCSPQAQKQGVRVGMPLGEAKALAAGMHCERHDAEADAATLRRLAWWCQRFGPWVAMEGADSLVVDVSGCGPLFGGEDKLAKQAVKQLAHFGFVAKAAVAPTIGAAWALARYQPAGVAQTFLSVPAQTEMSVPPYGSAFFGVKQTFLANALV